MQYCPNINYCVYVPIVYTVYVLCMLGLLKHVNKNALDTRKVLCQATCVYLFLTSNPRYTNGAIT